MLPVACGMLVGIVVTSVWPSAVAMWMVIACGVGTLVWAVLVRHGLAAVFGASLALGGVLTYGVGAEADAGCSRLIDGVGHTVQARIDDVEVYGGGSAQRALGVIVMADGEAVEPPLRVSLLMPTARPRLMSGDVVRCEAVIERSQAGDTDVPYEVDYAAYNKVRGIAATAYVSASEGKEPEVVARCAGGFAVWLSQQREAIESSIYDSGMQPATAAFVSAILVGDTEYLDPALRDDFRAAGLSHTLAISGLHVGIIAALLSLLLTPLQVWRRGREVKYVTIMVLIWIYALLTGLSPSVLRASVMVSSYYVCRLLQRDGSPYNALALAAVVCMVVNPYDVLSVGAQLSFAAVLSLLLFGEALNPVSRRRRWLYRLVALFVVPMAALLGTGVIVMVHFHTLPLLSVVTNAAACILMPVMLCGGIVIAALGAVGLAVPMVSGAIDVCYDVINGIASSAAGLPWAELRGVVIGPVVVTAYVTALGALAVALHQAGVRRGALRLMACSVAVAVCGVVIGGDRAPAAELYICRDRGSTGIVSRCGAQVRYYTTARGEERRDAAISKAAERYATYLDVRGATMQAAEFTAGRYVTACGRTIAVVASPIDSYDSLVAAGMKVDYALVCRGYNGDINAVARVFAPDTIIIARDNSLRRHDRWCSESCRPVISMRRQRFSLSE